MTAKPVKIMETVLRDGHQSLLATRMRFQDMESTLEQLDNVLRLKPGAELPLIVACAF